MPTRITIPLELWNDDSEGVIVAWLYEDGALVGHGAIIAEVSVEKTQFEVTSPAAGRLRALKPAEATVYAGETIGEIADP